LIVCNFCVAMIRTIGVVALSATSLASPPPVFEHAATARWMVQHLNHGVLSTTSTRDVASTVGDPFGNPYAHADAEGIPYFYASDMDASMVDIFTADAASTRVSFAMSEAQLTGNNSVAACEIGTNLGDPENPPCARLVLSGNFIKLEAGSDEDKIAKGALFERHPSFKFFPSNHDFYAAKIDIDGIWLIDFYGSATVVNPKKYFAANTNAYRPIDMRSQRAIDPRPNPLRKIKTARWMVKSLNWGVLSTTSARSDGSTPGDAFGNPYAFADDSNGIPYIYASGLDASIVDLQKSTRMTLALSEASLSGTPAEVKACKIANIGFGDPENPPCARLVLSGEYEKLDDNSAESVSALAALEERHPSFKNFPSGHDFFVAKMNIDSIWFIDIYGGATNMDVAKYLAWDSDEVVV